MICRFSVLLLAAIFPLLAALEGEEFCDRKTVLITGSSQGIGLAAAQKFQEADWSVWGGTRHITAELAAENPGIRFRRLDITDQQSIRALVAEIVQTDGKIDALVNNAGYGLLGPVEAAAIEEVEQQFEINLFSVMRLVNEVAPLMRERRRGAIIQISSTSGVRAVPGLGIYAASKFALEGYSEALAVELSPWNVHVSIVEPGTVKNDWSKHCPQAGNNTGVALYDTITRKLRNKLIALSANGQECSEIGELIVRIAEDPHPHLRYQTSLQAQQVFSSCLIDPSGDSYKEKWSQFLETLISE